MNEASYNQLVQASWRRRLTPAEEAEVQAYLALHPDKQTQWDEESALSDFLRQLPDAPVPSNFTSLVLQAIESERRVETAHKLSGLEYWHRWLARHTPKFAATGLLLVCGMVGIHQYHGHQQRQLAHAAASTWGEVVSVVPTPEVFEDFDTIKQLRNASAHSDEELLTVLQK